METLICKFSDYINYHDCNYQDNKITTEPLYMSWFHNSIIDVHYYELTLENENFIFTYEIEFETHDNLNYESIWYGKITNKEYVYKNDNHEKKDIEITSVKAILIENLQNLTQKWKIEIELEI